MGLEKLFSQSFDLYARRPFCGIVLIPVPEIISTYRRNIRKLETIEREFYA